MTGRDPLMEKKKIVSDSKKDPANYKKMGLWGERLERSPRGRESRRSLTS